MMDEDVQKVIGNFWERKFKSLSIEDDAVIDDILTELKNTKFVNPTGETPVKAEEFASWFDPRVILDFVKPKFPRFHTIESRLVPRAKFFVAFLLSNDDYLIGTWRRLDKELCKLLGFKKFPTYEILREFVYEKIGRDRLKDVFYLVVGELKKFLAQKGIVLGCRTAQDATDLPSLKHDPEAEYSGYYKEYGYKLDITIDLAQETLPLDYTPM